VRRKLCGENCAEKVVRRKLCRSVTNILYSLYKQHKAMPSFEVNTTVLNNLRTEICAFLRRRVVIVYRRFGTKVRTLDP
jgi:hypothetical protein